MNITLEMLKEFLATEPTSFSVNNCIDWEVNGKKFGVSVDLEIDKDSYTFFGQPKRVTGVDVSTPMLDEETELTLTEEQTALLNSVVSEMVISAIEKDDSHNPKYYTDYIASQWHEAKEYAKELQSYGRGW